MVSRLPRTSLPSYSHWGSANPNVNSSLVVADKGLRYDTAPPPGYSRTVTGARDVWGWNDVAAGTTAFAVCLLPRG